ncbi:Histone deacetylase clr3 [Penicillium odoratum]|uniref:Histone deacetylase clr3 n=1 Tax=Penicillium odoratum TaxID=1167516 RepID=UPI002547A0A9|nr:Histone deacetylase clr3 [Penicillium odoratum]KAJ5765215.1 Histone deacetylase clr3 [Penicillium odoratum]
MDGDKDTVMTDPRKVSTLPSHTASTLSTVSLNPHQRADLTLTPSLIPQTASKSPSSASDRASLRDQAASGNTSSPDRFIKPSPSESNSAENSLNRADSLVEPNSDWSDNDMDTKSGLPLGSLATGLCYDVRMRYHCEIRPMSDVHPEDPRRIYYIYKELCNAGLVDDPDSTQPLAPQTLKRINTRYATEGEISTIHTEAHFAFVKSTAGMSDDDLVLLEQQRDSIYFNQLTFETSLLSVGGAIETCLAVAQRDVKNAIAVIRPPGHHAEVDTAMGFCLFNNVSVAARVCQQKLGEACRKILILDWDVHHGNGIQKAFYDDPNVLYISIHVHQNGRFYPGGKEGDWDHCGEGPGTGKNVNIPWPKQGMCDGDYMFAFQQVVMPIGFEFDPDLVIVSAGFDAAAGDTLGGCFVSPACYAQMTHMLMTLANGKVAVCLEGGYNLQSISKSALAVTKTLMGDPPDRLHITTPSDEAIATVRRVMSFQAPYWRCMFPKPVEIQTNNKVWTSLNDFIRRGEAEKLYQSCKLTELYIYRTSISKSFENQVLASPNYTEDVPLVVIFHDPSELLGNPHHVTNKLETHNCWLADIQQIYVEWMVSKGYAVIDVNIPMHVTRDEATGRYQDEDGDRPHATGELAAYLWDNYIEPYQRPDIFFIGVGTAFYGITSLLINRDNLYQKVNSVISFVSSHPVRAVASPTQTWMSKWYRENSLVFVSHKHGVWDRTPSKRYGSLRKSPQSTLTEMLGEHKEEVFDWISSRVEAHAAEDNEDLDMQD